MVFASITSGLNVVEFEEINTLVNTGKLNKYEYSYNTTGKTYVNELPAWNNFGSSTLVTNSSFTDSGDYYTYFFDGYIIYSTTTTKYFGIVSDDDSFMWIIQGNKKWSDISHNDKASYTYIETNISNSTLVCLDPNNHGIDGNYTGENAGQYTFQANTLYTILIKVTEHSGGAGLYFGISDSTLSNQSRLNSTYPSEFGSNFQISIVRVNPSLITNNNNSNSNITLLNTGKLNRYIYDYGNINYTDKLPAWSNFGTSTLVLNTSFSNTGDYFTYFFDGYIYYTSTTTKYFGITSDDDSFMWIIQGDKKWSNIGHSDNASYTYVSNLSNSTLVCSHPGLHAENIRFSSDNTGEYTFQANTLYSILIKITEHTGGQDIHFGISNSSLFDVIKTNTNYPNEFGASYSQ
jgi:hypothetical protein